MRVIQSVKNDSAIIKLIRDPSGGCKECAIRVSQILSQYQVPYRVIALLMWSGVSDRMPANHYAIVASIDGQAIIIDPSVGQFFGEGFYGHFDDWIMHFNMCVPRRVIKARECINVREASISMGSTFSGGPMACDGVVVQRTLWYDRIIKNQAAYAEQEQRQEHANSSILLSRRAVASSSLRRCFILTYCFRKYNSFLNSASKLDADICIEFGAILAKSRY